jgi:hypothetical protein
MLSNAERAAYSSMVRRADGKLGSQRSKASKATIKELRRQTKNQYHLKTVMLQDKQLQKFARMILKISDV